MVECLNITQGVCLIVVAMSGATEEQLQMQSAWTMLKRQANLTCHIRLSKVITEQQRNLKNHCPRTIIIGRPLHYKNIAKLTLVVVSKPATKIILEMQTRRALLTHFFKDLGQHSRRA